MKGLADRRCLFRCHSRCVWKILAAFIVVLVCVLFIEQLRNVVLRPVLPPLWRDHSTLELVSVYVKPYREFPFDDREFPMDGSGGGRQRDNFSLLLPRVNLSDISKFVQPISPAYYRYREKLLEKIPHDSDAFEELRVLSYFRPLLTSTTRAQLLYTMDVFIRACRRHGWTYFLIAGTLLGAYRHHGLIPWDDDVDIVVNISHWREVHHVLSNTPGFTILNETNVWRFSMSDLPVISGRQERYPFIDLFFFEEDAAHLWGVTEHSRRMILDKDRVLPLQTTRWENWELPVPRCMQRHVETEYNDVTACVSAHFRHEKWHGLSQIRVRCSQLYGVFPFVFRRTDPRTGEVTETTRVGERVVEEKTVPPPPAVCLDSV